MLGPCPRASSPTGPRATSVDLLAIVSVTITTITIATAGIAAVNSAAVATASKRTASRPAFAVAVAVASAVAIAAIFTTSFAVVVDAAPPTTAKRTRHCDARRCGERL